MAAKKERDESERLKETNKFEDRTRDKAKEDKTYTKASSTKPKFDDDMMLSPISDVQGLIIINILANNFSKYLFIFSD